MIGGGREEGRCVQLFETPNYCCNGHTHTPVSTLGKKHG